MTHFFASKSIERPQYYLSKEGASLFWLLYAAQQSGGSHVLIIELHAPERYKPLA
jgi:hypothetical protein